MLIFSRFGAGAITVEVRRATDSVRRAVTLADATDDEDRIADASRTLTVPLVEPADAVRGLLVRVSRLGPTGWQAPLFPVTPVLRRAL